MLVKKCVGVLQKKLQNVVPYLVQYLLRLSAILFSNFNPLMHNVPKLSNTL